MANVKISQLPSWTGTAADLRWFVMNNSGETETFKYSGYTSPYKQGNYPNSVVSNSYIGNEVGGESQQILGGSGNTITNTAPLNNIIGGDNNTISGTASRRNIIINSFQSVINSTFAGSGYDNFNSIYNAYSADIIGNSFFSQIFGGNDGQINGVYWANIIGGDGNQIRGNGYDGAYSSIMGGYANDINNTGSAGNANGIFAGNNNTITNTTKSTIIGGNNNSIGSGHDKSIILGGRNNTTTNQFAFIGGGAQNQAGYLSAVINGFNNNASNQSCIIGGESNTTTAAYGGIFGGVNNSATGNYSTIIGGTVNSIAGGPKSFIAGGSNNTINTLGTGAIIGSENSQISENSRNGIYSCYQGIMNFSPTYQSIMMASAYASMTYASACAMIGGFNCVINGTANQSSTIAAGDSNTLTSVSWGFIGGGKNNLISSSNYSSVIGGEYNYVTGATNYSGIFQGRSNTNGGNYSVIVGGQLNTIRTSATEWSSIIGAYSSTTEGDYSHIFGGIQNEINSSQAVIVGGRENYIGPSSDNSEMFGCRNSVISGTSQDVTMINTISSNTAGYDRITMLSTSGRTATTNDATFVENLVVFNYSNLNYADDTAAAAGGVVLGQVYHNNGALRIRIV